MEFWKYVHKANDFFLFLTLPLALILIIGIIRIYLVPQLLCPIPIDSQAPDYLGPQPDNSGSIVYGLAWDDYFCVYTKGRTMNETLNTCAHEYGHTNLNLYDNYSKPIILLPQHSGNAGILG